jgi:hypothetical protein
VFRLQVAVHQIDLAVIVVAKHLLALQEYAAFAQKAEDQAVVYVIFSAVFLTTAVVFYFIRTRTTVLVILVAL